MLEFQTIELNSLNIQLGEFGVAGTFGLGDLACGQQGTSQMNTQMVREDAHTGSGVKATQRINGEVGHDFLFFFLLE